MQKRMLVQHQKVVKWLDDSLTRFLSMKLHHEQEVKRIQKYVASFSVQCSEMAFPLSGYGEHTACHSFYNSKLLVKRYSREEYQKMDLLSRQALCLEYSDKVIPVLLSIWCGTSKVTMLDNCCAQYVLEGDHLQDFLIDTLLRRRRIRKRIVKSIHEAFGDEDEWPYEELTMIDKLVASCREDGKAKLLNIGKFNIEGLVVQSSSANEEKSTAAGDEKVSTEQVQTVQFLDENPGGMSGFSANISNDLGDEIQDINLDDFLSRPVRIASYVWAESDPVNTVTTISPWNLYFNNTTIKKKLDNYSFIRCNLVVKVLINASPFYYGATLVVYKPNDEMYPENIAYDSIGAYLTPLSVRPHAWIFPSDSKGTTMKLPFIYQKPWLNVHSASDFTNMGTMKFINTTVLDSANGAVGTGVTIQVYAYATDVELSGATAGLALQSSEYTIDSASGIASAVAAAAGKLRRVPIIGPYAIATQFGSSLFSNVASRLGYSNPPVIKDVVPYRPTAMPPLASTSISYPIERLSVDPTNELSIDPRIAGLPPIDELAVSNLAQKEAFLVNIPWSTARLTDDILFASVVSPNTFNYANAAPSNNLIQASPLSQISQLFRYWRGDLIFRFKFIASPYHKGRVRVIWDPTGYAGQNIINTTATQPTCFNEIIDLGKDTHIEIRIPFNQATAWLATRPMNNSNVIYSTAASPSFLYNSDYYNGTLVMRVVTPLTAPVSTSVIQVMCSVRAAENFELAYPQPISTDLQSFQIQSSDSVNIAVEQSTCVIQSAFIQEEVTSILATSRMNKEDMNKFLVYHGEAIPTLRQLLHRKCYSCTDFINTTVASGYTIWEKRFSRMPLCPGYDPNGFGSAKGLNVPLSNFPFNFTKMIPLNFLAGSFIGARGSMDISVNVQDLGRGLAIGAVTFAKDPNAGTNGITTYTQLVGTNNAYQNFFRVYRSDGNAGLSVTNQLTQAGASVNLPWYSRYKFFSPAPEYMALGRSNDGTNFDDTLLQVILTQATNNVIVDWYYSAGVDFTFLGYMNPPTYRQILAPIVPN